MVYLYLFSTILSAVACVLCTTEALNSWTDGDDMNWYLLILGIINGILFVVNSYFLFPYTLTL